MKMKMKMRYQINVRDVNRNLCNQNAICVIDKDMFSYKIQINMIYQNIALYTHNNKYVYVKNVIMNKIYISKYIYKI